MNNSFREYEEEERIPISLYEVFRSNTLRTILFELDDSLFNMEKRIEHLKQELKEEKDKNWKQVDEQLKYGNMMMGQTLKAILSVPDAKAISPVMATTLMKIKDMGTIEEVHDYIKRISENIKLTTEVEKDAEKQQI